ncbi:MAG: HDOD domain-containing protein [Pseudomonadota bacterium]
MAAAKPKGRIGPFTLDRELGRGAQGVVYLARDDRLNRNVAIKTLKSFGHVAKEGYTLADEAAVVARLQHPNIVALYDIGEWQGTPYLVFEYVAGATLSQRIASEGALQVNSALILAKELLQGLAHAHDHSVLHCDVKPSNVLVESNGRARISDFGISRYISESVEDKTQLAGSVHYLAPELVDGKARSVLSDIYALGAVLFEMLTGQRAVQQPDATAALFAISQGVLPRPSDLCEGLDARVDAIVMRAMTKQATDRFASAQKMIEAIDEFEESARRIADVPVKASGKTNTVSYLLAKIRRSQDFPAFSQHVMEINRLASSDSDTTVVELTNAILRDYSLTNKLLRLVNSSQYGQFGGQITTVSRAVTILGFDNIRMLAVGLLVFEQIKNRPKIKELMEACLWSFTGAFLSRQIVTRSGKKNAEITFISSLLHRLGEQILIYYLPDEFASMQQLIEQHGLSEDAAARKVLGVPVHVVGQQIGECWGLPPLLITAMQVSHNEGVIKGHDEDTQVLNTVAFSDGCISAVCEDKDSHSRLGELAKQYDGLVDIDDESLSRMIDRCINDAFEVVEIPVEWRTELHAKLRRGQTITATEAEPLADQNTAVNESDPSIKRTQLLLAGINDVTSMMIGDHALTDILIAVLESIYRGLDLQRVLLMINNSRKDSLSVRFGFAADLDSIKNTFSLQCSDTDCVGIGLSKRSDTLIDNVTELEPGERLPPLLPQTGMLGVYPIVVGASLIGAIYIDAHNPQQIDPSAIAHIQSLRNQAALAIKLNS